MDRNSEKKILPLGEQVLARRNGARVNGHHRSIREMDNTSRYRQFNTMTKLLMILLRFNDKLRRTTGTKTTEHQWNDRSSGYCRIEISTLTKDQKSITHQKETVADDTANNQTTLTDFSKNLECWYKQEYTHTNVRGQQLFRR